MSRCPTIGLLIEGLDAPYQRLVFEGARRAARDREARLICFCGGSLGTSPVNAWEHTRNRVYDQVRPDFLDGIIISPSIGNFCGWERFTQFLSGFSGIESVSIGARMEGKSSVIVDNSRGIRALVRHCARDHGYHRFTFIGGPKGSTEGAERYSLFRAALAEQNLEFDEERALLAGDFTREGGREAANKLIEKGLDTQCVVACNDEAALGAIEMLQSRGRPVPGSLAVVGFDDIEESDLCSPPLTTVRQPSKEIGDAALQTLLALIGGESTPGQAILPTELIVRRSCGCGGYSSEKIYPAPSDSVPSVDNMLHERFVNAILLARMESSSLVLCRETVEEIAGAFCSDVNSGNISEFPLCLERASEKAVRSASDILHVHQLLSILRQLAWERLCDAALSHAEDLLHIGRVVLSELARRLEGDRRIVASRMERIIHSAGLALSRNPDMHDIGNCLADNLPHLGITSCVLDAGPLPFSSGKDTTVRFGDSTRMLQQFRISASPGSCHVVEGLTFQNEYLGTALFEAGSCSPLVFGQLREYLSNALHTAMLLQRLKKSYRESHHGHTRKGSHP